MKPSEIRELYDRNYAESYNANFLLGKNYREYTEHEVSLIRGFLDPESSWLDVACGTGYFLSLFQGIRRAGLDLSPAMLEFARWENIGVNFYERDFREDVSAWHNQWDLVTCMWDAYCYVESIAEVDRLIENMAKWTSERGTCFMPVFDQDVICKTPIPYKPPPHSNDGHMIIQGIVVTWVDVFLDKHHTNLIFPHLEHMIGVFRKFFAEVKLMDYPKFQSDYRTIGRKAIVARERMAL